MNRYEAYVDDNDFDLHILANILEPRASFLIHS